MCSSQTSHEFQIRREWIVVWNIVWWVSPQKISIDHWFIILSVRRRRRLERVKWNKKVWGDAIQARKRELGTCPISSPSLRPSISSCWFLSLFPHKTSNGSLIPNFANYSPHPVWGWTLRTGKESYRRQIAGQSGLPRHAFVCCSSCIVVFEYWSVASVLSLSFSRVFPQYKKPFVYIGNNWLMPGWGCWNRWWA